MTRPSWRMTLGQVLKQQTRMIERKSPRTGTAYQVEVVPQLNVLSTGLVEKRVDTQGEIKYRYSIVDSKNGLEYEITAPQLVQVRFGTALLFKEVSGGELVSSGGRGTGNGWYSATSVSELKR